MRAAQYTAGMLRTPVRFERRQMTPNGSGGFTTEWVTLRTTRAHVRALSGLERIQGAAVNATTKERMVVRYFADLTEADRVVIGSRAFNITFINNWQRRDTWLEIDMSGGVAT